jgi:squalene synthase HpnC
MNNQSLKDSYQFCLNLAKSHYENFPVASILIPKSKRKAIAAIYAFARIADDIADKENSTNETRTLKLIKYRDLFINRLLSDEYPHLPAIYDTIDRFKLSQINFLKLIEAFIQDTRLQHYESMNEILDYCSKSANPVGRILLELFGIKNEEAFFYSDKICTALQLTNFFQDLSLDISNGRFYIPKEILEKFNLNYDQLIIFSRTKEVNHDFVRMLDYLINFTMEYFSEGRKLLKYLSGFFKMEIKLTIYGGMEILKKIKKVNYNPFKRRPTLSKFIWLTLIIKTIFR